MCVCVCICARLCVCVRACACVCVFIPNLIADCADVKMLLLIFVGLLASTLAQPPMSTEKPRNFFQQIGDIFKDTFGAFTVSDISV